MTDFSAPEPLEGAMVAVTPSTVAASNDSEVVKEATDRWNRTSEYESQARMNYMQDTKFAEADDINGWQWAGGMREGRTRASKPSLTINMVRQHNLQIINEARKAKNTVKVVAIGGDASAEAASAWRALLRRIEYQSAAQDIYYNALKNAVRGGIGWWRLITRYAANSGQDAFDQEIYLAAIPDSMSVYIDPNCQQLDKSDAKFGYVFGQVSNDDFKATWPQYEELASAGGAQAPLGMSSVGDTGTWNENSIWFCEYFRKVAKAIKLVSFVDRSTQQRKVIDRAKLSPEMWDAVKDDPTTKTRDSVEESVEWFLIVGSKVIDRTTWAGKYIPLIPILGEETVIEGTLDRKGHTRALRDPQRLYNYNASSQAEFVALQTKTPWVAPARAIEGVEVYWNRANVDNSSVLPYNDIDDEGNEIQAPQRPPAPTSSPAFDQGMNTAWQQMMMASGQWQNQMGIQGNERTGAAIKERQGQADNSVAHYQDNFASALRFSARQLIDLIPKIYDTSRVFRILDDDGSTVEMKLDPRAAKAHSMQMQERGQAISRVLNVQLGQYDIAADVGPSYASKREETVEKLSLILTQAPALTGIIGDLLLKNLDIDEATEASQRLKRMVPPQALGQGPTQQEQQMQQMLQKMQEQLKEYQNKLTRALDTAARDRIKLTGKSQMRDIDTYDAETKRIAALQKMLPEDPMGLRQLIHQLVGEALQTHLSPIVEANANDIDDETENSKPDDALASRPLDVTALRAGARAPFARNMSAGRGLWFAPMVSDRKIPGSDEGGGS